MAAIDTNVVSTVAEVPPAAVTPTAVNGGGSIGAAQDTVVAAAAGLRYFGFTAAEDAGAAASFQIKNNVAHASGVAVEIVTLAPNESVASDWYGPEGLDAAAGISVNWISGSFKASVFTKVVS